MSKRAAIRRYPRCLFSMNAIRAKFDEAMLAPAFEVFCGVFALLAYRTLFHSDRSISVGSIIMLIALAAAITQLFTSSSLDMGVISSVSAVFQGGGGAGAPGMAGDPVYEAESKARAETGTADTAGASDLKTEVVGQIAKMCASNENAGYLASLACRQLF